MGTFLRFSLELLETVMAWRFESHSFVSFPVLQCIKMDGDSNGVFRWSGPGRHCFGG